MYTPEAFAVTDEALIAAMLRRSPLGCLVTSGPEGLFATHLPFLYDPQGCTLAGHLARANPHSGLAAATEALLIFQGPNAYVTPSSYPSKAKHGRVVPTWNYEAVHVYGQLSWRTEREWLLDNVTALTRHFEATQPAPWSVRDAPAEHIERLIAGIIGVEMRINRIEATRKLSQNRPEADRDGVITTLAAGHSASERELAELMRADRSSAAKLRRD